MSVEMKLERTDQGRTWRLFAFEYQTADGAFQGFMYALSHEHAAILLEELKSTAKLTGQVVSSV